MMNNIETMKMALEALETLTKEMLTLRDELAERGGRPKASVFHQRLWDSSHEAYVDTAIPAAESLRQAIEQAQKQEPVAWLNRDSVDGLWYPNAFKTDNLEPSIPLYTTPPTRQPLTDKELNLIGAQWHYNLLGKDDKAELFAFARAIEAAHGIKEKNT